MVGRSAVTVGVFDGVHLAHRWILRRLRREASLRGLSTVVITFEPHPLAVVRPVSAPRLLTDLPQRLRLLEATGCVDGCYVVAFDPERSHQSPASFVHDVLVRELSAALVLVGADFRFGRDRTGDVALLRQMGTVHGFEVLAAPLVPVNVSQPELRCSSTWIRQLVSQGDVERAGHLLGRPYEMSGRVVATSRPVARGGVPTVVVRVPANRCVPLSGSFVADIEAPSGRRRWAGATTRESADSSRGNLLDVHVALDTGELMDEAVRLRLWRRVWEPDSQSLWAVAQAVEERESVAEATTGWGGWA